MDKMYNSKLLIFARKLRRNMTKEEKHLWYDFLSSYKYKIYRQKIIGKYIVDFYCSKAKLVIEIDGSEHYLDKNIEIDKERTKYLEMYGINVIRIPNNEVNYNFEGVCRFIETKIEERINGNKKAST